MKDKHQKIAISGTGSLCPQISISAVGINLILALFLFGCEENISAQCEQIFQIAQDVNSSNDQTRYVKEDESLEMKSWLQAASKFNQAAENIAVLEVTHRELSEYQNQLAKIYRIYSQATYDAVRARENQNLSALKAARQDAIQAGLMQQELIQKVNSYCVGKG
ncbi:MAG: hypothetical protein AAFR62_09720 [Cyanobacteria bacterium J06629_2]